MILEDFSAVITKEFVNSPFNNQVNYANKLLKELYGTKLEGSYNSSQLHKLITKLENAKRNRFV